MLAALRAKGRIRIGAVLGIDLVLDRSFWLALFLLTFLLATQYFPGAYSDGSALGHWLMGLTGSVLLFASLLGHELAHCFAARRLGVQARGIVLNLFGGMTRTVGDPLRPWGEMLFAASGPAANLLFAAIFGIIGSASLGPHLTAIAAWLAIANGVLALGNLLPSYPLDGGRLLRALVWWQVENELKATTVASMVSLSLANLALVGGIWMVFVRSFGDGLGLSAFGLFLAVAAHRARRASELRFELRGRSVADVMGEPCPVVDAGAAIDSLSALNDFGRADSWAIASDGNVVGIITRAQVERVPMAQWPRTTAGAINAAGRNKTLVHPTDDALLAIALLEDSGAQVVPVVRDGHLVGTLSLRDLMGRRKGGETAGRPSASANAGQVKSI